MAHLTGSTMGLVIIRRLGTNPEPHGIVSPIGTASLESPIGLEDCNGEENNI